MTDQEVKNELIKYYEDTVHPFSQIVAIQLMAIEDTRDNIEWKDLCRAYMEDSFTPENLKFMYGYRVVEMYEDLVRNQIL